MNNFKLIAEGVDVSELALALKLKSELWGQIPNRTLGENSPHKYIQDIWVRANDRSEAERSQDYSHFNDMHYPVNYPAWYALPQIRQMALGLMSKVGATHLGSIFITKIPPGLAVLPHKDFGWNAEFFNCKLYIPLQANELCVNRAGDEHVVMGVGDIWYFNNLIEHEVFNDGSEDRITLIICMRVE